MRIERTKNTIRNSGWGIVSKVITTFFPVVVRSLIVQHIGAAYLGLGSLFSSILTVLSLAELGVSSAIVFSMYKPIAEDDTQTICALMALYKKLYSVIGIIIGIIGTILLPFLPYLIKGNCPNDINIYILYLIYLSNSVVGYFLFAYKNCLLTAYQRSDIAMKIAILTSIIQYSLTIVVVVVFHNYYLYVILAPIASVVNNLLTAYQSDKLFPNYKPKGKLDKHVIADIKQRITGLMLSKVAGTTRNTFDSIFISALLGLTTVTVYGNYYYIMAAVISVLTVITTGMGAGVGNSVAIESQQKNHDDMMRFTFIFMWISGWCSICLGCLYHNTMILWMGSDLTYPEMLSWVFAFYFYVCTMSSINGQYYNASGLWWHGKWIYGIEAILNLVLNYILGKLFGIYGIVLASILTAVVVSYNMYAIITYKFYFTDYSVRENYKAHIKYLITTVCNAGVTRSICTLIQKETLGTLVLKGIICILIPNFFYWIIYKKSRYYNETVGAFKKY